MIQAGEYTIPIVATISTGSTNAPPEFIGGPDFKTHANSKDYMKTKTNMTIHVLQPLRFPEWFKQGWETYGQPISIVLGGFAGGAASFLFYRFKGKKESSHYNSHQ